MTMLDHVRFALWGVASRPSRALAVQAVLAAGIAAVILVSSVVKGYGAEIERLAFGAYARSLVISASPAGITRYGPPRLSDLTALAERLEGVEAVAAWRQERARLLAGAGQVEVALFGAHGAYGHEADMTVAEGRRLTLAEVNGAGRLCLLGAHARTLLFDDRPAAGGMIRVNGVACAVVGVFAPARTRPAERFDAAVIAPFHAVGRYFSVDDYLAPDEAFQLTVVTDAPFAMADKRVEADLILRRVRGVPLSQPSPFRYEDPGHSVRAVIRQRTLIGQLLGVLAATCLVAGLAGFSAIMASAIHERRREIALRMAMGALGRQVVAQVLLETALLGVLGGLIGCALGLGGGYGVALVWGWPFMVDGQAVALALGLGLLCGLLAGIWPARRAAGEDPAQAARA
ncbi:hypothetical protein CCR85_13035 [Rhodothalassium salexigens]|uniref:ABC transporter permease n=1 Tax=Rhodothalassium salexigens TaxID=1086 RepID=UPI001912663C|nr:ABC transporter permease [Rhodothalassium salexigens]MBK5912410.1 hypothetical protein [Rhodothalassium salexigens]